MRAVSKKPERRKIARPPRIRLGVNIDHVATLRQLRAGTVDYPDIIQARDAVVKGGADQITIHLRGDRRHIQDFDLSSLSKNRPVPLNLEMGVTGEMMDKALKYKPDIVCLVPEKREEVTTEGGLDVIAHRSKVEDCVRELKKANIRISLFIEPSLEQTEMSAALGADAVEFHTGHYALSRGMEKKRELHRIRDVFNAAHKLGLAVHAGHGLDYHNVKALVNLPHLEELNIGHSIVCQSVFVGLEKAVREMKALLK
jgi:pyridoxine 5-phosphate synthase